MGASAESASRPVVIDGVSVAVAFLRPRPDAAVDVVALLSARLAPRVEVERAVDARAEVVRADLLGVDLVCAEAERAVLDVARSEAADVVLRAGLVLALAVAALPRVTRPVARLEAVPVLRRDAVAVARLAAVPVERRDVVPVARLDVVPVVRFGVVPVVRFGVVPVVRFGVVPVVRLDVVLAARLAVVPAARLVAVPVARLAVVPVVRLALVPVARFAVVAVARLAAVPVARLAAVPVVRVAGERVLAARPVLGADARDVEREVVPDRVADARSDFGASRLVAVAAAALPRAGVLLDVDAERVDVFAVARAPVVLVRAPRAVVPAPVRADARLVPERMAIGFEPVEEPFASSLLM